MSFRDDRLRLLDILAAIGDIEKHIAGRPKLAFADDGTAIDGVAYRLVIIGEAVASLPADLLVHEASHSLVGNQGAAQPIGPRLLRHRYRYPVGNRHDRSDAVAVGCRATARALWFAIEKHVKI